MKKKILITDDEMDMRIFMSTLVETAGYTPIATRNGKEGLRKVKEEKPDLIILDVMMPGEGGAQMYRELRTDHEMQKIPVIMLSGVGKKAFFHYLNMLNIGSDVGVAQPEAYIEKPPDPDEMLALIHSLLK
ncbi:MAG: hypothetical protein BWK80_36530 [Desulfobacteraceae bacterium IS3]|nr:MAG: hypothetical protein BWK80_36530 [Desulfobacteraceae bacterium IS3]